MSHRRRAACLAMLDRQLEQLEMDRALMKRELMDKVDLEFNKLRDLTLKIKSEIVKTNVDLPLPSDQSSADNNSIAGLNASSRYDHGQSMETAVDVTASTSTSVGRKRKSSGQRVVAKKQVIRQQARLFPCIYPGCGKSFYHDFHLASHERTHTGARPFSCTWPDGCQFDAVDRGAVMRHIRTRHLKLPRNQKNQLALNITEPRDPNQWVRVNQQLASERLTKENIRYYSQKIDKRRTASRKNPNKVYDFICRSPGCGQSFQTNPSRLEHERAIHLRVKPFGCIWPDCSTGFVSSTRGQVVKHVRTVHFGLPVSKKLQRQLSITDRRDPNQWVSVDEDEANRRVIE